ncbi:MAG TPA: DnaB-like helicase C-terminal domain-containing protein [Planctomycetota bacterium]|nr:DnaB-like helicase C-terminal domain-containing protein [Planctomycetota bacterium]
MSTTAPQISDVPPHDPEAEAQALGCMLLNATVAKHIAKMLTPADFYVGKNQRTFEVFAAMLDTGETLDNCTAPKIAAERLQIEGLPDYLGHCQDSVPTPLNFEHYCNRILEKRAARELVRKTYEFSQAVKEGRARETLGLLEARNGWACGIDLAQHAAAVALDDPAVLTRTAFIKTGYNALDYALGGGLAAGECTTLFAPSTMGKSTFALNIAIHVAAAGTPCGFISLEMRAADCWRLALGVRANIPRSHLRHMTLTTGQGETLAIAKNEGKRWPLTILDRRAFRVVTIDSVDAVLREGAARLGWKAAFIDYLAKVGPHDEDELKRTPKLTKWIFDAAQITGLHIVALAQSAKSAYGRKDEKTGKRTVQLEDVKGVIEAVADFDNVVGLVRDDWNSDTPQDPADFSAVTLKARQGPCGTTALKFFKSTGRIEAIEPMQDRAALAPREA